MTKLKRSKEQDIAMKNHIIITGDVIHSRAHQVEFWMPKLESSLTKHASRYDIYRGDSFQAEISVDQAIFALFHLKASMRLLESMDVRVGMGMGAISYSDASIKKSSGQAYIYSGEAFDGLGKETIAFKSENSALDQEINLILSLAIILAEQWTVNMAETVLAALENPAANQKELMEIIGRNHQPQVSTELAKANYPKIQQVIHYCTQVILEHA